MIFSILWACTGVSHPPPAGAALASLSIAGATLQPAFIASHDGFSVGAASLGATSAVTAVPEDPDAVVAVHLETLEGERIDSGTELALTDGRKVVVQVTSADGENTSTTEVIALPSDFPPIELQVLGEQDAGWLYLANFEGFTNDNTYGRYAMVLDELGVPRWYRDTVAPAFDLRRQAGGELTWVGLPPGGQDYVGVVNDTFGAFSHAVELAESRPGLETDVHEFVLQEDGSGLLIGAWVETTDLTPWGGPASAPLLHQLVQEVTPSGELAFEWSTKGNVDLDTIPQIIVDAGTGAFEYSHINSVTVDPDDGAWVISLRLAHQVIKVAREAMTVAGADYAPGDIVWRLGGADTDFTFVGDDRGLGLQGFYSQHTARPLGGDRILVFDNALWRENRGDLGNPDLVVDATGDARMVEYQLDVAAGTATLVDSFALPSAGAVAAGGSTQRLPAGGTLVGWGDKSKDGAQFPAATEIDATGAVVMEMFLPTNVWSYRVFRFPRP